MSINKLSRQFSTIFLIISLVISLNSMNKPKKTHTMKVYIKFIKISTTFSKPCCTLCASDSMQCPIKIFSKNFWRFSVKPVLILMRYILSPQVSKVYSLMSVNPLGLLNSLISLKLARKLSNNLRSRIIIKLSIHISRLIRTAFNTVINTYVKYTKTGRNLMLETMKVLIHHLSEKVMTLSCQLINSLLWNLLRITWIIALFWVRLQI